MPETKSNKPSKIANITSRIDNKFIKLMEGKKAGGMEVLFIFLLVIGLIVALTIDSLIVNYLVVVLSGLGMGILLYQRRYDMKGRYILSFLSFIIGYIVGVRSGIRIRLLIVFLMSIVFGYFLYKQFLKTKNNFPETEI